MIKLVAFDWNGTLLADTRLAAAGDTFALKPYTKKVITLRKLQEHFTIPIIDYLAAIGLEKNKYRHLYKKINTDFNNYYEARVSNCRTRGGVRESLKLLKGRNIEAIIYSNHVRTYINRQLKRLKLENHFKIVLGRQDHDSSHMHSRGQTTKA